MKPPTIANQQTRHLHWCRVFVLWCCCACLRFITFVRFLTKVIAHTRAGRARIRKKLRILNPNRAHTRRESTAYFWVCKFAAPSRAGRAPINLNFLQNSAKSYRPLNHCACPDLCPRTRAGRAHCRFCRILQNRQYRAHTRGNIYGISSGFAGLPPFRQICRNGAVLPASL